MITIWIHVIVILYLMAHITLYQMYYPMLLNRTHQKFKDSRAIKVLNIKLHYMSNKFYEFMFAFLIYFFGVSNLVLPSISNSLVMVITQTLTILLSLYFFYMQAYVLSSYEKAIVHANKNLKKT